MAVAVSPLFRPAAAGIASARLLVLAVPDAASGGLAAKHARAVNREIAIVARAHSSAELPALRGAGMDVTVVPEFEGAVAIVREPLRLLDNEEALLASMSETVRSLEYGETPANTS